MKEKSWMTPAQVAEEMEVSRQAVHGWIKRGLLPAYRVGERYRIKCADVGRVVQGVGNE